MKKVLNEKGFTLMELMIVVAIIAILAAIALPTISGAIDKARDAAEIADVRSTAATLAVFVSANDITTKIGDEFKKSAEYENVPKDIVKVSDDGTIWGLHPLRTNKMGKKLKQGEYPCIPYGQSLTSKATLDDSGSGGSEGGGG